MSIIVRRSFPVLEALATAVRRPRTAQSRRVSRDLFTCTAEELGLG